jgi:hypothetical protein
MLTYNIKDTADFWQMIETTGYANVDTIKMCVGLMKEPLRFDP